MRRLAAKSFSMMLAGLVLAAAAAGTSCWNVYDAALGHSAQAARPPYVTYVEQISIQYGDPSTAQALKPSTYAGSARVQYRGDGLARVEDERFGNAPIVTSVLDPGPPELGPYGDRQSIWEGVHYVLPLISSVRAKSSVTCTLSAGLYQGRQVYHLEFRGASPKIPHLDDLWVDAQSNDIWKVALEAPLSFNFGYVPSVDPVHFEVDLGYEGRYLVVQHVRSEVRVPTHGQLMHVVAQYAYGEYAFPAQLPQKVFESP